VIRRDNPEAQYVLEHDIPYLSMPGAIASFFLNGRESIVVAGTHGKSTTSALLAWILECAGLDPSVLIGGFVKNWDRSYRLGSGPHMVLEGDEYDTAFFDKGPKFLHYQPQIAVITSVEFDHADIFSDFQAVQNAFRKLVETIPPSGCLVVNGDDPHCLAMVDSCSGNLVTYGESPNARYRLVEASYPAGRVQFTFESPDGKRVSMISTLPGRHNLGNTLAAVAVASRVGIATDHIQRALLSFAGVKRRQDVLGEANGVLVVDDFAHHPTAVKETIRALRLYYPERRLLALFEPRTNSSRRKVFQDDYAAAFDDAHLVCIKQPPDLEKIPENERMDASALVMSIRQRGNEAHFFERTDQLMEFVVNHSHAGDLALAMSNGSFDKLPERLLAALQQCERARPGQTA
jgi:UDP-N-acetylmuramate: L-alanyl-gamma-D-glutamyl-meso-diaminopimelate ligase